MGWIRDPGKTYPGSPGKKSRGIWIRNTGSNLRSSVKGRILVPFFKKYRTSHIAYFEVLLNLISPQNISWLGFLRQKTDIHHCFCLISLDYSY